MVWLRLRRWVVRPIFWALAGLALLGLVIVAFLRSELVRERAREIAERQLTQRLGSPVRIGRLDFTLLPLAVVARDVVLSGERPGDAPWLTVGRLVVEIDADALRRDLVDLQTVTAEGVRLHVVIDAAGRDNLPRIPKGRGGGGLAVRVGGLFLTDGSLELADAKIPLDLEAHDVEARLAGVGGTDLEGRVSVSRVRLALPGLSPVDLAVEAKTRLRADRIEILDGRVVGPQVEASVRGEVGWRQGTHGELALAVNGSGAALDALGVLEHQIVGPFRFSGELAFARRDWRLAGQLAAPALELFGFAVEDLSAAVEGGPEQVLAAVEEASYRGAAVRGTFTVGLGKGRPAALRLRAEELPVRPLLADLGLPDFAVAAGASGELVYDFALADARRGRGSARLAMTPSPGGGPAGVPAGGEVALALATGRLELERVAVETPGGTLAATGGFDLTTRQGELAVEAQSLDLAELVRIQPFVASQPPPIWLPTAGRGELTARIRLAPEGVEGDAAFDLAEVVAPGAAASRARGSLELDRRAVRRLELALERRGATLAVSGSLPLDDLPGALPVALAVEATDWPVEQAWAWLPLRLPLDGRLSGDLRLSGSLAALEGELTGRLTPAEVAGVAVDELVAELAFDRDRLTASRLELALPAGRVTGSGSLGFAEGALDLTFAGPGLELSRAPFSELWGERIGGLVDLDVRLTGTTDAPRGEVVGRFSDLRLGSRPLAAERPPSLHAELGEGRLELALEVPEIFTLSGGGPIAPGVSADLQLQLSSARLDRLAELATGREVPSLSGRIDAEIALRQAEGGPLRTEFRAPTLELETGGHRLTPLEPITATLERGELQLTSLYLGEAASGDEFFLSGRIGVSEPDPPLDLRLQASGSVEWLRAFTGLDLTGRVAALATIHGTLSAPSLNGQAELADGRWIPPGLPHSFEAGRALLLLYPDFLVLDQGRADFAGGVLTATGRIDLARGGAPLSYRLQANAKRLNLRYPEGWLLRGDGDLTLTSSADGRQVRGLLQLDRVYYLQDVELSAAQLVERLLSRTRLQVEETDELLASTYLSVAIEAPSAVRIRNNLANLTGSARLNLRGTLARPVLFGDATAEPGGTVAYGGNTYTLERGVVSFANPTRIEPLLDVVATTKVDEYAVRVTLSGTLDRLATNFSSDPPLPDLDVLALLTTGATTGDTSVPNPTASGEQGAGVVEGMLYGQAAALLGQRVGHLFGIDKLRIDPTLAGSTVSSARVTVGKRLGRRVYVTYTVDPSSTAQQVLQVEWRLTDQLTLVLTQSGNDSYAMDARWETRF